MITTISFFDLGVEQHPAWQDLYEALLPMRPVNDPKLLAEWARAWQLLDKTDDKALTDWLIRVFDHAFAKYETTLVRGGDEPEYFAKTDSAPAKIVFAHGYFSSALHEISHWCIAGSQRRTLDDFGYWYCPDGRDKIMQDKFEQVEIRPQAVECLLTLATGRKFFTSADNLNADFDTSDSTFEADVYRQALTFLQTPMTLPRDARALLVLLLTLCQPNFSRF